MENITKCTNVHYYTQNLNNIVKLKQFNYHYFCFYQKSIMNIAFFSEKLHAGVQNYIYIIYI